MKIIGFFHGVLYRNYVVLKSTNDKDNMLIKRMFESKKNREERSRREILLKCEIDAAFQKRSFKQLASVWKLVSVIFESMEQRKPTESERYDLYLDLLEEYADKVPSKLNGNLRCIHISESNTESAARFIDGLLYHLATQCDLKIDLQADVRNVLYEWEIWRGKQERDINDNRTVEDLRKRVVYSEASGNTNVDLHHILSRGAFPQFTTSAWNLIALTREEHVLFHAKGWSLFLNKYPHLKGRIEQVFNRVGLTIPFDFMEEKKQIENNSVKAEDLARLALGE